jgi:ribosomal protein S18 acetylase RimI-like enzyme
MLTQTLPLLSLLKEHESVVLYVAHDNPAAAKVYHKVGFRGLLSDHAKDGVEDWLELGFDRKVVELGHW